MSVKPRHICDNCGNIVREEEFQTYEIRRNNHKLISLDFCNSCLENHIIQVNRKITATISKAKTSDEMGSNVEEFITLWNNDTPVEEIASTLHLTPNYVYHKAHLLRSRGMAVHKRPRGRRLAKAA